MITLTHNSLNLCDLVSKDSFVNIMLMLLNYSKSIVKSLNNKVPMEANLTRVNYTVSMDLITSFEILYI